jgi:hypothetical protein
MRSRTIITVNGDGRGGLAAGIGCAGFFIACAAAWLTHVVWVIGKLAGPAGVTGGQLLLGALGSFVPPVGVIHGVMIWCGAGF